MKRTVVDCDRCGIQLKVDIGPLFVETGRSMDPSGNGYETDGENVDLCPQCMFVWVEKTVKSGAADEFLKFVRNPSFKKKEPK